MRKPASHALEELVDALKTLPGVGARSAQRMAMHLLERDRVAAKRLSQAIDQSLEKVGHCQRCNTLTDAPICDTCLDQERDVTRLCVVDTASDQSVIERTGTYKGHYFVLLGSINPLQGQGIGDTGIRACLDRASDGEVQEVIIATGFHAQGEATAHVLSTAWKKRGIHVTRLAKGVPIGSELEFVDLGTIAHALLDRRPR